VTVCVDVSSVGPVVSVRGGTELLSVSAWQPGTLLSVTLPCHLMNADVCPLTPGCALCNSAVSETHCHSALRYSTLGHLLPQLSPASLWGYLIEYQLCWGTGGNATSAAWQVTLCDPMWHVSSRSGGRVVNCYAPFTFTFLS